MGEPSLTRIQILALPPTDVELMFQRQFPGATISDIEDGYAAFTLHATGTTKTQAMENALIAFHDMVTDAKMLDAMLNDVDADLKSRGYSKKRHDWAIEILGCCSQSLNNGVLTSIVPYIQVPGYTRKIDEYIRRADTRLNMLALELQQEEAARRRAGTKFPRKPTLGGAEEYAAMRKRIYGK